MDHSIYDHEDASQDIVQQILENLCKTSFYDILSLIWYILTGTYVRNCMFIIERFWPIQMLWSCPNYKALRTMNKEAVVDEKRILITCEGNIITRTSST